MLDNKDIEKLSEVFATKEDINNLSEVYATKENITEFKNEILEGQDEIIEKLSLLLEEKVIGGEQDKRHKKVLEIHNKALKRGGVLMGKEVSEITIYSFSFIICHFRNI